MHKPFAPSSLLPDYLKAELRVGETDQWPLLRALDEGLDLIAHQALARVFDLMGSTASYSRLEHELRALGWEVAALSDSQREALYSARYAILQSRGTLGAVEILADIYFPGAHVSLGRPFAPSRMGSSARVTLVDRADRRQVVFVRTPLVEADALCAEFRHNVALLLPEPFSAVLAFPKMPAVEPERLTLATPRRWERRVPCLISRK